MGGFSFINRARHVNAPAIIHRSRLQFRRSGFSAPFSVETENFVFDYYEKIAYDSKNILKFDDDNFIASVGTLIAGGATGQAALEFVFEQADPGKALSEARGHFAVIICRNGVVSLLRDRNYSCEVFYNSDLSIISTSYLAVARTLASLQINAQEAYEYVFQGVSFGRQTPLAGLYRLDFGESLQLAPNAAVTVEPPEPPLPEAKGGLDTLIAENLAEQKQFFGELGRIFGNRIKMGLSGGYDSRLMLALFRASGVTPQLVVYGNKNSVDVAAAKRIASAENLPLRHLDKSGLGRTGPDDLAAAARENFEREDGLPLHGILERDHERFARLELAAGGMLHIHGGGGEIYRNFFNTPDRTRTTRQLVRTFFNAFDPSFCTGEFLARDYENALCDKIHKLLGRKDGKLSRREIEYLYPHFRCRSWFGRENSLNSRYFHSILPFYESHVVRQALQVPVRHKYFGNFESRMIRAADPALARHMSNYGHDFMKDAPAWRAALDYLTYLRPPFLRLQIRRIKIRLAARKASPAFVTKPHVAELVGDFPFMSRYFIVDRIKDEVFLSRLCALEYLCQTVEKDRAQSKEDAMLREMAALPDSLAHSLDRPQREPAVA